MDHHLLSVHMIQHLLLMSGAAPLLLLGSPMLASQRGLPLLNRRPKFAMRAVLHLLHANPVFCWFAASAVLIWWHIPWAFALGMSSARWHHCEHATFFAAGLLFWWPVIPTWPSAAEPQWSTVVYLFLATLPCDALSAFLAFCDRVVYPAYRDMPRHFDISPLADQQFAGALMWVSVTFAYLVPAAIITTRLLSRADLSEQALTRPDPSSAPSGD
jgi:cytochrome c oxidase assembly factor CtaG